MDIGAIINLKDRKSEVIIADLKEKSITLPSWAELRKEYEPKEHPVMDKANYPDRVEADGGVTPVTRTTYALQKLAVKRLTQMCFGIPVKRVYDIPENRKDLKKVADVMEQIFKKCRIDTVNIERGKQLFASCEVMTLWYAEKKTNKYYGIESKLKMRCVTYSPMKGDELYPLFDEYGDLIALSVQYTRKKKDKEVTYFDAYTADKHYKWSNENDNSFALIEESEIVVGKIPAVYIYRPESAWEDTSPLVYEMEWAMSRNGNYLRENSRPLFVVYADEEIPFGKEPPANKADKSILKYPKGSNAGYVTWQQAVDSLKFQVTELRQMFFTQLQIPDWSFDNMKAVPQSGESMKQMFIDAVLKVTEESGRFIEAFDREINIVREFMKMIEPKWSDLIDELSVSCVITPCMIDTQSDDVEEREGEVEGGTRKEKDTKTNDQ